MKYGWRDSSLVRRDTVRWEAKLSRMFGKCAWPSVCEIRNTKPNNSAADSREMDKSVALK